MNSFKKNMMRQALKTQSIEDVATKNGYSVDELKKKLTIKPEGTSTFAVLSKEKPIINESDELIKQLQSKFKSNQSVSENIPTPVEEKVIKTKKKHSEVDWVKAGKMAGITRKVNKAIKLAETSDGLFDAEAYRARLMAETFPDKQSTTIPEKVLKEAVEHIVKSPVVNVPVIKEKKPFKRISLLDLKADPNIIEIKNDVALDDKMTALSIMDRTELLNMEKRLMAMRNELIAMITLVRKCLN